MTLKDLKIRLKRYYYGAGIWFKWKWRYTWKIPHRLDMIRLKVLLAYWTWKTKK